MKLTFKELILVRLFVVSYSPLGIIIAIQNSTRMVPVASHLDFWVPLALGSAGLVDAYRLPRGALRKTATVVSLKGISEEGGQVAAYVATFLLPFLGLDLSTWRHSVGLLVYLAVLLAVFVQSDLALVNPALYLMGWRVVSATTADSRVLVLLPASTNLAAGKANVVTFGRFYIYKESA